MSSSSACSPPRLAEYDHSQAQGKVKHSKIDPIPCSIGDSAMHIIISELHEVQSHLFSLQSVSPNRRVQCEVASSTGRTADTTHMKSVP